MWRYDFHLFYLAGQAVLTGTSPYAICDFNPPFLLAMLFAPIAWLPENIAYFLYLAGCLWLMWKVMGRRFIWAALSFPVWFNLFVGQVDLPLVMLVNLLGPWGLPLILIKPQLGFIVAPWIIRRTSWKRLVQAVFIGLIFFLLSLLLRPTWVSEWLAILPSHMQYSQRDSNLYWLIPDSMKSITSLICILLALPAGFLMKRKRDSWVVLHLFAPFTNIYSASVFAEWIGPLEVLLSWLAIILVGGIHSGAPMFVIVFSIILRQTLFTKWGWKTTEIPQRSTVLDKR